MVDKVCVRVEPVQEEYDCVKDTETETCGDEPRLHTQTCFRQVAKRVPYECEEEKTESKCEEVQETVKKTCRRYRQRKEERKCGEVKSREVCRDVMTQQQVYCSETVHKVTPYQCATKPSTTTVCQTIPKLITKTCQRPVTEQETYPCEKATTKAQCTTEMVPQLSKCSRPVKAKIPYETSRTEYRQECRHV
eukprot:GHVQ01028201.1.p1 GENE.GHVQ01028201.1~~GHVQ01028201.1.p1  ORF type:complete len:192 (-),score=34.39 GHVQ01028201.1:255-830(-)